VPNCVPTVLLRFVMKIQKRRIEGCVDCYYIFVLLDSSPSARLHMLEVAVFCSLRMLPAVLCSKIRNFFFMRYGLWL